MSFILKIDELALAETQAAGLRWTVRHAYANSPFYRRRLTEC